MVITIKSDDTSQIINCLRFLQVGDACDFFNVNCEITPQCIFVILAEMNYLNLAYDVSNGKTEAHHQ
jgi:hypothetical protein